MGAFHDRGKIKDLFFEKIFDDGYFQGILSKRCKVRFPKQFPLSTIEALNLFTHMLNLSQDQLSYIEGQNRRMKSRKRIPSAILKSTHFEKMKLNP